MAKKVKTDVSMDEYDRISDLPQVLLQHIQYYLTPKQATQTIILSKAWRNTLSNRPTINFDKHFCNGKTNDEILSLAKNTLQCYHDQKLRVMEFGLRLSVSETDPESFTFLDEWIPIVVRMGVKKFSLKVYSNSITYNLPRAVFKAESITELSLKGCSLGVIMIKNLKVLKLSGVKIKGNTFKRIISSCSNLESITICNSSDWFPVHKLQVLPNLKYLSLKNVFLCTFSSDILSFHFTSLEKLELVDVLCREIKILGDSIKHIILTGIDRRIKVHVNAPNLLSFELNCDTHPPTLYFAKTSSKWESEILLGWEKQESSWLNKLNEMLKELSQSKISLELDQLPSNCPLNDNIVQQFEPVEMQALEIPFKKNLSSDVINGLFCVCRPIMVFLSIYTDEDGWSKSESKEFVENMCKILMKTGESSSSSTG